MHEKYKSIKPAPSEKLADGQKFPTEIKITAQSIELFHLGAHKQGYVYFIDAETSEAHLLPAANIDEKKESDSKIISPITSKPAEKQIKPLIGLKRMMQIHPVLDKHGMAFRPGQYVITNLPKTTETGGTGGGYLHHSAEILLKLAEKKYLVGGGFWINTHHNDFDEFRTRASRNMKILRNPLFMLYFRERMPPQHLEGHSIIFTRELPFQFLKIVLIHFYATLYQKKIDPDVLNSYFLHQNDQSIIPSSTRLHLEIEQSWLIHQKRWLNAYLSNAIDRKKDGISKSAADILAGLDDTHFIEENIELKKIALKVAIKKGHLPIFSKLIQSFEIAKVSLNSIEYDELNMLEFAAYYGQKNIVTTLQTKITLFSDLQIILNSRIFTLAVKEDYDAIKNTLLEFKEEFKLDLSVKDQSNLSTKCILFYNLIHHIINNQDDKILELKTLFPRIIPRFILNKYFCSEIENRIISLLADNQFEKTARLLNKYEELLLTVHFIHLNKMTKMAEDTLFSRFSECIIFGDSENFNQLLAAFPKLTPSFLKRKWIDGRAPLSLATSSSFLNISIFLTLLNLEPDSLYKQIELENFIKNFAHQAEELTEIQELQEKSPELFQHYLKLDTPVDNAISHNQIEILYWLAMQGANLQPLHKKICLKPKFSVKRKLYFYNDFFQSFPLSLQPINHLTRCLTIFRKIKFEPDAKSTRFSAIKKLCSIARLESSENFEKAYHSFKKLDELIAQVNLISEFKHELKSICHDQYDEYIKDPFSQPEKFLIMLEKLNFSVHRRLSFSSGTSLIIKNVAIPKKHFSLKTKEKLDLILHKSKSLSAHSP